MSAADEIEKLRLRKQAGSLSEAEFEAAKTRALEAGPARREAEGSRGISRGLWAFVVVVLAGAGAALVMLDEISRSVQIIAGGAGIVAAAAGCVMSVAEDLSITAVFGFGLAARAIGAVAFAALSPILIPAALVLLALVTAREWIADIFTS